MDQELFSRFVKCAVETLSVDASQVVWAAISSSVMVLIQPPKVFSLMQVAIWSALLTPASTVREINSSFSGPGVPSCGWFSNSRLLNLKKLFGEYSATQTAAFAALDEYSFGEPRPSRNDSG